LESRVNYTLVGFFVIVMSTALVMIAFWLTAGSRSKDYHPYLVYMQESVGGLSEQAAVKFNGVQVGYVEAIRLDKNNPQLVRIKLEIEDGTPITTSTRAMLMSQGITGIAYVGLMAISPKAPPLVTTEGQPYPVIPSSPSLLVQLDKAVRDVSQSVSDMSNRLQRILSPENELVLKNTLHNFDEFTSMLRRNNLTIERGLHSIEITFQNAAEASRRFPNLAKDMQETFKTIRSAADEFKQTLASTQSAVDTVSDQAIPPAVNMMERLQSAAKSVNALSKALEENPSTIIRGRAPAEPGPGE
jgi:phospholipid/cholesterol/gamma-HCH transport system substrate-binding protein